jgi:SAM-dependent methyltransferase
VSDVRKTWGRYSSAFAAEGTAAETRDSIRRLIELCDLPSGSLVLDVATGAGYNAFAFARTGCRVIPSDPTHEMLLATKAGWTERSFGGDARCVETWAESHEAKRVVKSGGVCAIADQSPPDGWEDWHNDLERMRDPTHEHARSPREWRIVFEGAGLTIRASDVVFQEHDVEEWFKRVDCPPKQRDTCLKMLDEIPEQIRDVYRPEVVDGRLRMRTPQCVLVAQA